MLTITEKEFLQLSEYIKINYGIRLKEEKKALVIGRLHHVLQQAGFTNFTDYFQFVINDKTGDSAVTLVDRITTNHTFFMREADHFFYFRDKVLPQLAATVKDKDLRIWCAASSSGEEPYTLAMIIDDFFGKEKSFWDTRLLATDISERMLGIARKAVYSNERIAPLLPHWKVQYFKKADEENSILVDRIRNNVIYRKFNLMDEVFPFKKKFHTIFCRNVMIYFDIETKAKLVNRLYNSMENGGFLFLGHSESLNRENVRFRYVMPSVYRKE